MQRRSKRLVWLNNFESHHFRGIGNYLWKNPENITHVATTSPVPEQSLEQWCFNAGRCPHGFYFAVVLSCFGISHWGGLNPWRRRGDPWLQIQRDWSHYEVRSSQCLFCCLEHVWLGGCFKATRIHLWNCPWTSVWGEKGRHGRFAVYNLYKPWEEKQWFLCSWQEASPTRVHQPLQEPAAATLIFPACASGSRAVPSLPI